MRQLKLLLPALQLCIAIILLQWGYRSTGPRSLDTVYASTTIFVCFGINAPAIRFKALALLLPEKIDQTPPSAFGFSPADGFFLSGVVVLWFLVAQALDRRSPNTAIAQPSRAIARKLFLLLPVICGCVLFYMGLQTLRWPERWNNSTGNIVEGTLFLAWSLTLIVVPCMKLVKGFRRLSTPPVARQP